MERIGVRSLRQDLSALVRRAGAGERVVITVDGRPLAQLGPLEADEDTVTIDDLVARGLVIGARRDDRPEPGPPLPLWAGTRLDQLVREIRGR
jgi:prevent-host-death family protein